MYLLYCLQFGIIVKSVYSSFRYDMITMQKHQTQIKTCGHVVIHTLSQTFGQKCTYLFHSNLSIK